MLNCNLSVNAIAESAQTHAGDGVDELHGSSFSGGRLACGDVELWILAVSVHLCIPRHVRWYMLWADSWIPIHQETNPATMDRLTWRVKNTHCQDNPRSAWESSPAVVNAAALECPCYVGIADFPWQTCASLHSCIDFNGICAYGRRSYSTGILHGIKTDTHRILYEWIREGATVLILCVRQANSMVFGQLVRPSRR